MTTETIAAVQFGLTGTPLAVNNISSPFNEGRLARQNEQFSFLTNPYRRLSDPWRDWRAGWLRQDLGDKDRDIY